MDFGTYIAKLRDGKDLSLRELEKKADDLNHVYIWRLEKGDRDQPSPETLEKLRRALEPTEREWQIALLLLRTKMDDALFRVAAERTEYSIEDIEPAATASMRGNRPTDEAGWIRLIETFKEF